MLYRSAVKKRLRNHFEAENIQNMSTWGNASLYILRLQLYAALSHDHWEYISGAVRDPSILWILSAAPRG